MAFEKYVEFNYDDLPLHTKYRFAELELNQALKVFSDMHQFDPERHQKAFNQLYQLLFSYSERFQETEEALHQAKNTHQFMKPHKTEVVNYMLYHQQSYKTITELTKTSPNTIAKHRFQPIPHYYPVFTGWNEPLLAKWEAIKHTLNLWEQNLVHTR